MNRTTSRTFSDSTAASSLGSRVPTDRGKRDPQVTKALRLLNEFLGHEVSEVESPKLEPEAGSFKGAADSAKRVLSSATRSRSAYCVRGVVTVVQSKTFFIFFTFLTLYALFAPDIDGAFGNKESQRQLAVWSTVVFSFFLAEVGLQCIGKDMYLFGAYFWLDLIAVLSLVPDTIIMQAVGANSNFLAAGRSSRLTRFMRVFSRSSKATRLIRLVRIVRVATLVPRLVKHCQRRVSKHDVERLLSRHLHQLFMVLDDDADERVTTAQAVQVLARLRACSDAKWLGDGFPRTASAASGSWIPLCSWVPSRAAKTRVHNCPMVEIPASSCAAPQEPQDEETGINFEQFKALILQDEEASNRLHLACAEKLKAGNNMENLSSRHSEYIGVKVALSVLFLLIVLSFMQNDVMDHSTAQGLQQVQSFVRARYMTESAVGTPIQPQVWAQVDAWFRPYTGFDGDSVDRRVLYLDIFQKVVCSELDSGQRCALPLNASTTFWGPRKVFDDIDRSIAAFPIRVRDLLLVRLPTLVDDIDPAAFSDQELDDLVQSMALIDNSQAVRSEAVASIATTCVVIAAILLGILMLTRDLTFLSVNLLKPLKELADEMENIVRLKIAGCAAVPESDVGTTSDASVSSEARLIRRTFENMKVAIRSWGKYVPWPVVRLLLHSSDKAGLQVREKDVTIFFSDIASFTTIVESLPPERSLLLLSRYFNDMSKVIDEFEGIVIEFIGDAIYCIYGDPVPNRRHASAGVKAALRMMASLDRMNQWFAARDLPTVSVRCGLHTGTCLVGNMGFQSRMKYGIVGEECEVPPKLEELNKNYNTQILISKDLRERIMDDEGGGSLFLIRPIDCLNLRPHVSEAPELIYEVLHPKTERQASDSLGRALFSHERAWGLYLQRDFAQAADEFRTVSRLMMGINGKDDEPSSMMVRRCEVYMKNPPGADWQGAWDGEK
mmetsp:Transcript_87968/g.247166  ORF Transcript_87968/g.247166 Transcript_87968/m.247166 type:complete len:950 (-) Transcript_87968:84-2933(-)